MEQSTVFWTVALCSGLTGWFLWETSSLPINYDLHSYLLDQHTGRKLEPSELIDLGKIINYTESYINQTNAVQRLHDLAYQMNLENPINLDQSYSDRRQLEVSGWPIANQTKCARDLDWINSKLAEHREFQLLPGRLGYELTRLLDSFGRPETGLYAGTVTWPGSYGQCMKSTLNGGLIKMRYCQARLRPTWWPEHELVEPKSRIKMGFCVPESCDTLSFGQHKSALETLLKFDLPEFHKKNFKFESLFCLPDERSPIRQLPLSGRLYLLLVCAWLSILLTATLLHELTRWRDREQGRPDGQRKSVMSSKPTRMDLDLAEAPVDERSFSLRLQEALSIHYSLKVFKSNVFKEHGASERARVDLGCLDFIKVAMAFLVVLAHSGFLNSIYTRSLTNRIELNVNELGRLTMSVGRCVDTFFMLFGILTSFTVLKKFTVKQLSSPLTWMAINLGIILRITPVFLLVFWYSHSISPYTGSGPWWDYGVLRYSIKGSCLSDPWWKSIPYFGCAGTPAVASCVLPAWFIVSYSQLSLLMPLLTYLMCKLPNHLSRISLIMFITTISSLQFAVKMHKQTTLKEEAFSLYGSFLVSLVEKFQSTGTMATLGRLGCVAVGCYVGYLLRMYELGEINCWPKWLVNKFVLALSATLIVLIAALPILGHWLLHSSSHKTTTYEFIGSYLITSLLWPLIISIVLINCVTELKRKAFVRFLAHSCWHVLNKLGLCIYLVHWEVIFVGLTSHDQGPSMGFIADVMKTWAFGMFFSILIAFILHILFEAPLSALLRLAANSLRSVAPDCTNKLEIICDTMEERERHGHLKAGEKAGAMAEGSVLDSQTDTSPAVECHLAS